MFPRGLYQPSTSFRFSIDALLLAAFVYQNNMNITSAVDLGTGCGVAAFALLRRNRKAKAWGIELQPNLAEAAAVNAATLGLENRFTVICDDVKNIYLPAKVPKVDLVLANPPYYRKDQGKHTKFDARNRALFAEKDVLEAFCQAAASVLRSKGYFSVVFSASRLPDLLRCITQSGLGARRLMAVHGKKDRKADIILLEAKKGAKDDLLIEAPLILYEGVATETRLSEQALLFCPDLRCNAQ